MHEDSGDHRVTTCSLTVEVEAVTHASLIRWHMENTCHHCHRLHEPAAKSEVLDGLF